MLAHELRELLGALDVMVTAEGVHPPIPLEEHRSRIDVLGEALRLTASVRDGGSELPGIRAGDLVGVDSEDPALVGTYVRELLEGVDADVAALLLEDLTSP